jgi:5'-3' exonuclease
MFQVVRFEPTPVHVVYVGRGWNKAEVLGPEELAAKYSLPVGNAGSAYADMAVLRGDPSDGLPGVAGVGEKTAARLVARYGGIEQILAALDDPAAGFAPGVRTKLDAARDYLAKALPVCKVALDVKLPDFDPALPRSPKDPDALLALAERWNLAGSARRLVDALAA